MHSRNGFSSSSDLCRSAPRQHGYVSPRPAATLTHIWAPQQRKAPQCRRRTLANICSIPFGAVWCAAGAAQTAADGNGDLLHLGTNLSKASGGTSACRIALAVLPSARGSWSISANWCSIFERTLVCAGESVLPAHTTPKKTAPRGASFLRDVFGGKLAWLTAALALFVSRLGFYLLEYSSCIDIACQQWSPLPCLQQYLNKERHLRGSWARFAQVSPLL